MLEINININAPDLCKSLDALAAAIAVSKTAPAELRNAEPVKEAAEPAEAPEEKKSSKKPRGKKEAKAEPAAPVSAPVPQAAQVQPQAAPIPAPVQVPYQAQPQYTAPAPQQVMPQYQAPQAAQVQPQAAPIPAPAQAPVQQQPIATPAPAAQAAPVQTAADVTDKLMNAAAFIMDHQGIDKLNGILTKYGIVALSEAKAKPLYPQILQELYALGAPVV